MFLQEHPVNVGVPQYLVLYTTVFLIWTDDIDIYANDTTLHLKYNDTSDLWQPLVLVSEFKIQPKRHCGGRKLFANFNLGKFFYLGKFNVEKTLLLLL